MGADLQFYIILIVGSTLWVLWSMASNGRGVLSNLIVGMLWSIGVAILLYNCNDIFGWNFNKPEDTGYMPNWVFFYTMSNVYQGFVRFAFKRY